MTANGKRHYQIFKAIVRDIERGDSFHMAQWKRLTGTDGDLLDVNMDAVAYLHPFKEHTAICFIGGRGAEGRVMVVSVKEKPDAIHMAKLLHSV